MPAVKRAMSRMNKTILGTAARLDVARSDEVVDDADHDSLDDAVAQTGSEHCECFFGMSFGEERTRWI